MQSDKILEIEIQLLLIKYGFTKVMKAIANNQNQSIEHIEQLIVDLKTKKTPKRKLQQLSAEEIVKKNWPELSAIDSELNRLAIMFDNKTFLPQLKDVRRFIERQQNKSINLKTRISGVKRVFEILKQMTQSELHELIHGNDPTQSDFSLLSDQIIQQRKKSE